MNSNRLKNWITLGLAVAILVPSLWGFGSKLLEFVHLYRGETDGAFAIAPLLNYLLASAGFFLLFLWAAMNGMFHDIEGPKYTMLEREEELNSRRPRPSSTATN
jgi:nitrogen fixation-related uncharacterized protein